MEKYSSADREMCSQFKQVEVHQMEKYIGRMAKVDDNELPAEGRSCNELEVVGYNYNVWGDEVMLIADASQSRGWSELELEPSDVIFKKCKYYWYVSISDLID